MPAYPLIRNLSALRSEVYDLLVVGGGIYGAWTAADAARRGLRVALIERHDWGSGTSSASSKLIHGGLRYLEHFEFGLVRHALAERRVLSRIAPHLVRPLAFALPVFEGSRAGMFKLSAGLTLYDTLATRDQPVPKHRRFAPKALEAYYPFLRRDGLKGGFSFGDCQEDDARMTLAVVAQAQVGGAVCASRVAALELATDGDGVTGAEARDELTGDTFHIRARTVVAAAGPWLGGLLPGRAPRVRLVKGTHVVLPAIPGCEEAFLLTAPQDGRVFFVIPWYGRTLVGTTEATVASPAEAVPTEEDISYLLDATRANLPGLRWGREDVISAYAGVRTLQDDGAGTLAATTREFAVLSPLPRLFVSVGGKYTTARFDAAGIVDGVCAALGRNLASTTDTALLPGAPDAPTPAAFDAWLSETAGRLVQAGVDADAARFVALRHGTRAARLLELIAEDATWARRIHPDAPFVVGEAILAAREEMAIELEDIVRRRMPLRLIAGHGLDAALAELEHTLEADAARQAERPGGGA